MFQDRFDYSLRFSTLRRLISTRRGREDEGKNFSDRFRKRWSNRPPLSSVSETPSPDCSRIRIDPRTPREDPLPTEITRALRADNRIIAAQAIFLLGGDESRRVDSAIADISSAPEIFFLSRRAFVKKKTGRGWTRSFQQICLDRTISKAELFFRYVASL